MQQSGSLLDHLIGERQKIHRQLDARGFCGLEVNDELVMRRLLERQISWPRAAPAGSAARGGFFGGCPAKIERPDWLAGAPGFEP